MKWSKQTKLQLSRTEKLANAWWWENEKYVLSHKQTEKKILF